MVSGDRHRRHGSSTGRKRGGALPPPARVTCKASDVFDALWSALADVMGPTATAALMQRSVKRAAASTPELEHLVISRQRFVYTYSLPRSWNRAEREPRAALKQVVDALWPLLRELTGSVVVRRLREEPLLRRCGVIPEDDTL